MPVFPKIKAVKNLHHVTGLEHQAVLAAANGSVVWGDVVICSYQSGSWRAAALRDLMDVAAGKLPLINAPNLQKQGNRRNA